MSEPGIYTVSGLTEAVRGTLEGAFPFVWVRGQVVNLARPSSGHVYFSLRDEESTLAAVWFKGSQKPGERFDPLTGEVYEDGPRPSLAGTLENGQELICAGRLRVYGARGVYQLVVELAQDAGLGRLHEEFERLRRKLTELGYFALERKRRLPEHPVRVAVVTAPQGAAIQDFLRIAEGRGWGAAIRIYPSPVQGDAAPAKLTALVRRIGEEGWADVLVLIRGGGSLEDLWAFNDEALAEAIFTSPVPVLAGIGHEVDFTLADMTADVRAATPTHAAQILWPAREELLRRVGELTLALQKTERQYLERLHERFATLVRELTWRSPERMLSAWQERIVAAVGRLRMAVVRPLEREGARLLRLSAAVERAPQRLPARQSALDRLSDRLAAASIQGLTGTERSLERLALRLEAVNPHAPLERGYALVRKADGSFVRSTSMVRPGEELQIMVHDGEIPVRVTEKKA